MKRQALRVFCLFGLLALMGAAQAQQQAAPTASCLASLEGFTGVQLQVTGMETPEKAQQLSDYMLARPEVAACETSFGGMSMLLIYREDMATVDGLIQTVAGRGYAVSVRQPGNQSLAGGQYSPDGTLLPNQPHIDE